jgi:hypothetical protein
MHIGIPQALYVGLTAMGFGISLKEHGTPKTGTNNVTHSIISLGITYALLYYGGFFK